MSIPVEIYPLSTQDGKSIPLDIISPEGMVYQALTTSWSTIALTSLYNTAVIFSTTAALLDITNTAAGTPASGSLNTGMLYIPAETVVTLILPTASIKVRAVTGTGDLYINGIRRWAALALPRQFSKNLS